jgi:hypothetical protein
MRTANRRNPAIILLVEGDRGDSELIRGWLLQGGQIRKEQEHYSCFHLVIFNCLNMG